MNVSLEEAIQFIEEKLRRHNSRQSLTRTEKVVLKAAWDGLTYAAASELPECEAAYNTLQSNVGPALWNKLTLVLGKQVRKKSFKRLISLEIKAIRAKEISPSHALAEGEFVLKGASLPPLEGFVGREAETDSLLALIQKYACVFLVGLEGTGKKSLVANMLRKKQNELPLQRALWKPLSHRPSPKELESELSTLVGGNEDVDLLYRLCSTPYIIVLDSIDSLAIETDCRPSLDPGHEALLRRISEESLSKLIVISTQPTELSTNLGFGGRAIDYRLGGLSFSEAQIVLGSHWNQDSAHEIWKTTGGHPLMLREAAKWRDYAPDIQSQLQRLTVLANLFEDFYEKIFKRLRLSSSDVHLLKEISAYSQGIPFSSLLKKDPTSMLPIANLIMMGLVRKSSNKKGEDVIETPPLLSRALMGA